MTPQERGMAYRRALDYLQTCGPMDSDKFRQVNRIAGNVFTEADIQDISRKTSLIIGGWETVRGDLQKTFLEGVVTFESVGAVLGGSGKPASSGPSADKMVVCKCCGQSKRAKDATCPNCKYNNPAIIVLGFIFFIAFASAALFWFTSTLWIVISWIIAVPSFTAALVMLVQNRNALRRQRQKK